MALTPEQRDELRQKYQINPLVAPTKATEGASKTVTGTARDFAIGLGKGALQSVVDTSTQLVRLGQRVQGALDPTQTYEQLRDSSIEALRPEMQSKISKDLEGKNTTQKVGKVAAFGAEVLTPMGGRKLASKGIDIVTDIIRGAKNVVGKGAEKTGGYAVSRVPKLLGIFSGDSDDVVRTALKNPQAADKGIEAGDEALRQIVNEGSQNSVKIRDSFTQGYSQAKKQVMGQYDKVLVPKQQVQKIFNDLLRNNGVKLTVDGADFSTSKIIANPGEIKKIEDARNALANWDSFTVDSLDEYKQLVGKLTRFADDAGTPSKSPFLGRLYNELNNVITSKLPKEVAQEYKSLNNNFSQNIELYDDVVEAFNSGDPFTKIANSLGKNKDSLRQVIEFYEKQSGTDVLPQVAGRELAMEKNAAFGFLNPRSWIDFLISPKTQAKVITKIGGQFPNLQK